MPKMKKLQQNRSRTCTANPDEYSLHRLHFPSSTGSAPSDPAHRPSAPFRHYKRRRSRSGQADDTPRLTIFHVSHDRHRDLPPNRRRTEKSQTDCPTPATRADATTDAIRSLRKLFAESERAHAATICATTVRNSSRRYGYRRLSKNSCICTSCWSRNVRRRRRQLFCKNSAGCWKSHSVMRAGRDRNSPPIR